MLVRLLLAAAIVATPVAGYAQDDTAPPSRIRSITLQPGQKCPPSTKNEVIVCAQPDQEQYRIPKALREEPKTTADSTSWAVKSDRAMADSRRVLPGSCSPIGSNGATGCAQQAAEQWSAEKRAAANGQSVTPND
jgi:hypothetical protein